MRTAPFKKYATVEMISATNNAPKTQLTRNERKGSRKTKKLMSRPNTGSRRPKRNDVLKEHPVLPLTGSARPERKSNDE